jgi:NAD-dependent deacetylase
MSRLTLTNNYSSIIWSVLRVINSFFINYSGKLYFQNMKNLVVLSGAGMSQESGLKTFRDMGGLWESYDVTEVATPEAWKQNPELVLRFYNERRKQLWEAQPNAGHLGIARLEQWFDVDVVTQNVDDLHERAGSSKVLHLHGELRKARSTSDPSLIYELENWALNRGDLCERGSQLRPHIVWFGEAVTAIPVAIKKVEQADVLVVIGTSLAVYPAAGLVNYAQPGIPVFVVDPARPAVHQKNVTFIEEKAAKGIDTLLLNLEKLK